MWHIWRHEDVVAGRGGDADLAETIVKHELGVAFSNVDGGLAVAVVISAPRGRKSYTII
jgi:hypothetical protein